MVRFTGCDICMVVVVSSRIPFIGMFMRTDVGSYFIDPYVECLQIRAFIVVFLLVGWFLSVWFTISFTRIML